MPWVIRRRSVVYHVRKSEFALGLKNSWQSRNWNMSFETWIFKVQLMRMQLCSCRGIWESHTSTNNVAIDAINFRKDKRAKKQKGLTGWTVASQLPVECEKVFFVEIILGDWFLHWKLILRVFLLFRREENANRMCSSPNKARFFIWNYISGT